jgi:hypothetical protein
MISSADEKPQEKTYHRSDMPTWLLLAGLAAVFVWRVCFSAWVNLIPDECSYWTWSRRLDWSYFDNSGMVAYLIRLSTELFGRSTPFTVRFPFLVLSGLLTYLFYRVSLLLFQDRFRAILAALVFNLTPLALLGGAAAVHDNALMFFWTLSLWAAVRFVKSGATRWFYVMGIASGLAIQSKYTGVLVLPCLLIFFLWSGPHRKLLRTKEPWIGVLIASFFALPILWWNTAHDWASLHHILYIGSGSSSSSQRLLDGLGYHLAQFAVLSPFFYFALLVSLKFAFFKNLFKPQSAHVLLLSFGLPLALFGAMAFKGHVEANWAFVGYVSTAILAVQVIAEGREQGQKPFRNRFGARFLRWSVVLAVVPVLVVVIHAWFGIVPASLERKYGKDDRIIWETRGWGGLGEHVGALKQPSDVIAADSYQLCALLEFNVPGQPTVRYLAPWRRPTQFDVWEPSFDNLKESNIIFVSTRPLEPSSAALTTIYENFSRVESLPPYKVLYHGEPIREIYICRGYNFDPFSPKRLGPRSLKYQE